MLSNSRVDAIPHMAVKAKLYRQIQTSPAGISIAVDSSHWNTRLRELANKSLFSDALSVYFQLLRSGASPNAFTYPFALKSCAALSIPITGKQLHCHVIRSGCLFEPFVQTSMISMYSKCFLIDDARQVFDEYPQSTKQTVCYNALIAGYALHNRVNDAVFLFGEMRGLGVDTNGITMLGLVPVCGIPGNLRLGTSIHCFSVKSGLDMDSSVANSLLTMYAKSGEVDLARKLFNLMPVKGLITWNAMINGYSQNGLATEVLELYREMESSGISPDPTTFSGVLSSGAHLGALAVGREIEERMKVSGFSSNPFLNNALINMYARCGSLVRAKKIFDSMPVKSVVSWTAIICGYGIHGQGEIAVELFDEMIKKGIQPDGTAFVSVLYACSHAGLTDKGLEYFGLMQSKYRLQPGPEHYSCVVDLLGRAGRLDEARKLIESMKVKPDGAVWGALLGACRIHRNVELAELAFEKVIEIEPTNIGYYVLLSNIYTKAGNSDGLLRVRLMMRERKLRKDPGCSYVEFNGRVNLFFAGDRNHPQQEEIYRKLDELENLLAEFDGYNKDFEGKRNGELSVHSEKLAVTFGILKTMEGSEIVVIKNLRICGDCHLFIKSVSNIVNRRFVVRDATRFHHFENGICSCKEYW